MIVTTTHNIEGKTIQTYLGVVTSETLDIKFKSIFNNCTKQEELFAEAKKSCLEKLQKKADALRANAIVGVQISAYMTQAGEGVIVNASGTAVIAR